MKIKGFDNFSINESKHSIYEIWVIYSYGFDIDCIYLTKSEAEKDCIEKNNTFKNQYGKNGQRVPYFEVITLNDAILEMMKYNESEYRLNSQNDY